MKKILVTGSEGFIGSHLVELLLSKGFKVRAFVFYNSFNSKGWLDYIKPNRNLEFFFGDIRDYENINNAIIGCDIVIHLAALISIPYSFHSSNSFVETNIKGTLNILNSSRKNNIKKIIITSTSEIFGTCKVSPMSENHPINPQSPYAASKVGADQLAKSFFYTYKSPVIILRPFNTFGPRQSLRAIIPTVITQILKNKNNKIKLGNIDTYRDFNLVTDIVNAFLNAVLSNKKEIYGQEYNIGSGVLIKIKDIVKIVEKKLNKKVIIISDKKRLRPKSSEVLKLISDSSKFKKTFNWKPKVLNKKKFILSINDLVDWYMNNIKSYKDFNDYNF
tara:strand:- start:850 stop:1848 length:999 start_codon:yes stop_codon:yes gene_type:complete